MAYTEHFHGGIHSVACGGDLYLLSAIFDVTIWRHIHVSNPTFWRSLLTKSAHFSTQTLLILCIIALNINYSFSAPSWRSEEITSNAMIQQFMNAKILGYTLKQLSKTHSSLRQSNSQLQNQAALMSRWIRAVEHRCTVGLAGARPGLQDQILLNYFISGQVLSSQSTVLSSRTVRLCSPWGGGGIGQ